ncbi:MAG TPA: M42 family metallopeptidase [Bryobacteraceae bacterium]|nr:M42 family metallopeptidase [Bryobacteraceae bacterium]HOQ46384.1 M42 family metallopeptidase [Bryobacteraceae bacterium]HPQ14244.1 M42 family metallopeptidase [Bryobacteraceae bacterium]HPU72179.1 M42 family metallopeptidase [Bryobacteraceae bacterium]
MDTQPLEFLKSILEAPSPSGYERPVQEIVRRYAAGFADEVTTDVHGNVIAVRNPGAPLRVMLAGHCDQIGFLVRYIDNDGFLYVQPIGGWDPQIAVGQKMTVWTESGPVFGVIARKPIHLLTEEERKQVTKLKDLWIDIGAKDQADACSRVRIGDPVTLELSFRQMLNERASAPAMDDKSGLWIAFEALRRTQSGKLNCALYAVSTVQEEIGLRGSKTSTFRVDPHVGIAIDVCHATDSPSIDKKQEGDIALDKGPVIFRGPNMNPRVVEKLIEAAKSREIPYQLDAYGRATGTDANAIQITRAGVAAGLIGVPNRYMHSPVEMVSLRDLDRAADLLAAFALSLTGEEDFTP